MSSTGSTQLPPLFIDGLGFWSPTLPGWAAAGPALRDEPHQAAAGRRPAPALLPPAERRRAPDTVALALEVAAEAVAGSGHDPATLPSVFASAYGDLGLLDNLCSTLATQPTLVSPTKFHNSVHNAASGYWTIGTHCHATSSAVSAYTHSFAAGLLEAAVQCAADDTPVLLVAYDGPAVGALASTACSEGLLAAALVLSPQRGPRSRWALQVVLQSVSASASASASASGAAAATAATPLRSAAARTLAGNAMADVLPLCEALAAAGPGAPPAALALPLSAGTGLQLTLTPLDPSPTGTLADA